MTGDQKPNFRFFLALKEKYKKIERLTSNCPQKKHYCFHYFLILIVILCSFTRPALKWVKDGDAKLKSRPMTNDEIFGDNGSKKGARSSEKKEVVFNESEATESVDDAEGEENAIEYKKDAEVQPESKNSNIETNKMNTEKSLLVEEMDEEELRKFYEKKRKTRPGLASVKAAIEGKRVKRNSIFEEPSKSIPLPRQRGTINVTFSERKFPTPARESSQLEEQEVFFSIDR